MCGIFGHIGTISRQMAERCTDTLAHRGPDGRGLWHQDGIALGHRRLAILDLSEQGRQPMSYAHERYWITFNGEIYNFIEIRAELKRKGYAFKSDSDTEVILASFAEWKEKCLDKFNGMWAFAIWDRHKQSLFLARDRFGKKPLFYSLLPSGFAFASEMKALAPLLPEIAPNMPLIKNRFLMFQYEQSEECLIRGIKRLPAGHYGWWINGALTLHRWWSTLDHLREAPQKYDDQVERFRELFLDACRLRMRSDVPIGTALSGGLDSSATICSMAHIEEGSHESRINKDWQHAFVACFPGTPLDESYYARKVTDHLGIKATYINIDPTGVINRLYDYLYLFEELYITSPIPFMMTYGAMKHQGIKVTVDGHGADELFGGYSFDYIHTLSDAGFNLDQARMILNTYYDAYPKGTSQFPLPPKWSFWLTWHGKQLIKKAIPALAPTAKGADNADHRWRRFDHLNKILYNSSHTNILPTILRNYDRYSMANGVEIRMPFMDHRVVTFAFSIPWTSKIRNGYSKAIIRDAMAPYMPGEVTYRKSKIGFNSPIVDWMKGPLKSYFLDIINSQSFTTCRFIDAKSVAAKVKRVMSDDNVPFLVAEQAWTSLTPYLWEQSVLKRMEKLNQSH